MASFDLLSDHPWAKTIPGFVRELGTQERLLKLSQEDETDLLATALFILSKVPVTDELIRGALSRVMVKVPNLKLTILDHVPEPGAKPVSVFVAKELEIPLETTDETDWIRQLSKEWRSKYELANGPLWRVKHLPKVVLGRTTEEYSQETVLVFCFLHSIMDGMSYQFFFGEFLEALEIVNSGTTESPEPGTYSLPVDYYLPGQTGCQPSMIKGMVNLFLGNRVGKGFSKWLLRKSKNAYLKQFSLPIDDDPSTPIESCVFPLELSREETSALTLACKNRGVKVNGAVQAAATIAFDQILHGERLPSACTVDTYFAVSLRRLRDELKNAYGMFSTVLEISPKIPKDAAYDSQAFWQVAEYCSETVHRMIVEEAFVSTALQMDAILPLVESGSLQMSEMTTQVYGQDPICLSVTNMGRCDFMDSPPGASFKSVGQFGGGSGHINGGIFTVSLNTFNGQMYLSILYSKHIVPAERAKLFANYMKQILLRSSIASGAPERV